MHKYFTCLLILYFSSNALLAQKEVYSRVDLLLKTSRPAEAFDLLDSLGKSGNESSKPVFQAYKAQSLLSLQRYEEAIEICTEQISKMSSKDTLLHKMYFLRSLSYDYTGKRDLAIENISKAIKLKPKETVYYINASFYYGEQGDYKSCLSSLQKAYKLEPESFHVLNNLSYYSAMNGEYQKAIDYANKGIAVSKDTYAHAVLLNNRGFAEIGMKDYEAAASDIGDAIKIYPENPYAYYNKALLHIQLGNADIVCENLNLAILHGYPKPLDKSVKIYCKQQGN